MLVHALSAKQDHPRVRGEKIPDGDELPEVMGSPPRARGKDFSTHMPNSRLRITPACAGKSLLYKVEGCEGWDHPRVRGEKWTTTWPGAVVSGSPPRARGKVITHVPRSTEIGITPACAGKRTQRPAKYRTFWDHPRVRGEKRALLRGMS